MPTVTPYITPNQLVRVPTGVNWQTIPSQQASATERQAAQQDLCNAATRWVDGYCGQPLRATADREVLEANGNRAAVDAEGVLTLWPRRWPVLAVAAVEVRPVMGQDADYRAVGSTGISLVANPGVSELAAGAGTSMLKVVGSGIPYRSRSGSWLVRLTYTNGWPHAGLVGAHDEGATALSVDNALGWVAGMQAELPDGAGTEYVTVQGVTLSGDGSGTLALTAATLYGHAGGVPVTTLPETVWTACAYYVAHLAIARGSTSIAIPPMAGAPHAYQVQTAPNFMKLAQEHLRAYRRVF